jgi:GntR family transcriptional regulator
LAAFYGIGRPTVRQALETLVQKGLVTRRRGSGTYVRRPRQEIDLFSLDGTSASFRKKGVAVHTRMVASLRLEQVQEPDDNPFDQRSAYFLSRLTLVDGQPVLVEEIFLDNELFPGLDRIHLDGRSLSAIAREQYYLQPNGGKQNFRIGHADQTKADMLQIDPGTPVLVVHRFLNFPQMNSGVFARLWCRTDRFVFSQHLGGDHHG